MSIRQLIYEEASQELRLEFPYEWSPAVASVSIQIESTGGTALLAATAATVKSIGASSGATAAGATSITLASSTSDPAPGDVFRILDSTAGPGEWITCASFAPESITTEREMMYAHATATTIRPWF